MADILQYSRLGWKIIWKNNIIWIFSTLLLFAFAMSLIPIKSNSGLIFAIAKLALSLAAIALLFIGYAGIIATALEIAVGKHPKLARISKAIQRSFGRIILFCSMLIGLFFFLVSIVILFGFNNISKTLLISEYILPIAMVLSLFSALLHFPLIEMIRTKSKVRQSIKAAWEVFLQNLFPLALLGLVFGVAWYILYNLVKILFMLFMNHFNLASLQKINLLTLSSPFANNFYFPLVISIVEVIWLTYYWSTFTAAYLRCNSYPVKV